MAGNSSFRWWKAALITLAVVLFGVSLSMATAAELRAAAVFAVLVFIAGFLRIEGVHASVGFEAAVVFASLVIFHDPAVAMVSIVAGAGAYAVYRAVAGRSWELDPFYSAAQLVVSYGIAGALYSLAVAPDAPAPAKLAGFTLVLAAYLGVRAGLLTIHRALSSEAAGPDLRRVLMAEGQALVFVAPVVAIEVMLYESRGLAGFVVGFIPVVIYAYAMRNESEAEQRNGELVRRNRELAILTESSTQILSAESDEETMRRLSTLLAKLAGMKACAVVTWEAAPDVAGTVYRFGECMRSDQEILRWVDSAGFAQSAPSRAFVFQSEMRKLPLSSGNAMQVLIGIQTPEVIYGILLYETDDPSILKAGSLNLLTLLANQTALSLQDQLLRREMRGKTHQLEQHAATMSTILDVSNSLLIGQFDVDASLTRIAQAIRRALGFENVLVALYDPRRELYVRRAHAGMDEVWTDARARTVTAEGIAELMKPEFRVSNSYFVSHTALRANEHDFFVRADAVDEPMKPDEWHENDMLIVPLIQGGEILGYFWVSKPLDHRIPGLDKVQALEIFATQAVTALQSARQYEEIRRLTIVDSLTSAYNHRYFQDSLARELHRHSRNGNQLALAMLDIDNFKQINDTYGHPIGDEILKGLVDELVSNRRDTDIVARYGGEEFAIIFPDTDLARSEEAAGRLREVVARRVFVLPQLSSTISITVSIGIALYPADATTAADLIARADAALYWAKKHGKNRVSTAREIAAARAL